MISIIVPIYNTSKYLRECIESILSQTYKDLEIILIDDGSQDNSLAICKEYEKRDNRIKVYHKKNSGVSDTRNFGLSLAKGELISFCDSDDIIDKNLYKTLFETMIQENVDRICGGYSYLYERRKLYCKPRLSDGKYSAQNILSKMIDDGTLSGFLFSGVNNSLFKKDIILKNKIYFNKNLKYNEDSLFSFEYMLHSKSIYSLQSKPLYLYRQHDSSTTKKRILGNKYKSLHETLNKLDTTKEITDFKLQMQRRMVTEALWEILDISEKENLFQAFKDVRNILYAEHLIKNIKVINFKDLNKYKKIYYYMMLKKNYKKIVLLSKYIFPITTKYLSR